MIMLKLAKESKIKDLGRFEASHLYWSCKIKERHLHVTKAQSRPPK